MVLSVLGLRLRQRDSPPAAAAHSAIDSMINATEPAIAVFEAHNEEFTRPRNADVLATLRNRRRLIGG